MPHWCSLHWSMAAKRVAAGSPPVPGSIDMNVMMRSVAAAFGAVSVVVMTSCAVTDDASSVFTDFPFEEAKAQAFDQEKLFIVYGTADWCAPCNQMEQTTWVDEDVVRLLTEEAVVYKIDVDKQRDRAQELGIRAMPTLIAYKAGEEFERIAGYRSAEGMRTWIEDVKSGRRSLDRLREEARVADDERVDIQAKMGLARGLYREGEYEEAAEKFLWLWVNMLEHRPSMVGVRHSFFISDLQRLFDAHPPSRTPFIELRDEHERRMNAGNATRDDISDWQHLNNALGEKEHTLAWYDHSKEMDERQQAVRAVEPRVFWLLIENDRWVEAGQSLRSPVQQANGVVRRLSMMDHVPASAKIDDAMRKRMREHSRRNVISDISRRYAALLAAERHDAAEQNAAILLEAFESEEDYLADALVALVEASVSADVVHPRHIEWLDQAREYGADVDELERLVHVRIEVDV